MKITLTPQEIVAELDKYIIGQHDAKKAVAIALRNRWRRQNADPEIRKDIVPNNILMIGSTGIGKTEIARRLAALSDAPFVKVEASKFTEVGYVGRDVESMVRDLVEQTVNLVKVEKTAEIKDKAIINANETLLDILIPPVRVSEQNADSEDQTEDDSLLNEGTREKFREMIAEGKLDHRIVEIETELPAGNVQVMGPVGMEGMDGLQDMLNNLVPRKKKKKKMTLAEAREYLADQEVNKLLDTDQINREAVLRAQENGIIFIDEIDKIASNAKGSGPDVSREGVQRDLLPIVEGTVVNTKYGMVKTDHVLFIAAGAFHVSKPSDLIPELQGRFPIRVTLNALTQEDLVKILSQPQNALTRQYQALLNSEGASIEFTESAIEEIAESAFTVNQEIENIGARRLQTIMSRILGDILYEVPDLNESRKFVIDEAFVKEKLKGIAGNTDLSKFIL